MIGPLVASVGIVVAGLWLALTHAALPVAGFSGTLTERYRVPAARAAAGVVRAKTGTLTGVSALAGVVHDRSGALLAFAILADDAQATDDAEAALDAAVARLSACGCR